MLTRETRDGGALVTERRPHLLKLVSGERGWAAAVAAFGFGRGDPFGGEFVLQVALELPDGGDDVDDQGCGGVVGGQVVGVQPKLAARQQAELVRMHATGDYTIAELMEVFSIGRATVYRVLDRTKTTGATDAETP
ncbi:MAG: helix-turn-helix domain-containing protein, partial [Actinoallomurus sp.]